MFCSGVGLQWYILYYVSVKVWRPLNWALLLVQIFVLIKSEQAIPAICCKSQSRVSFLMRATYPLLTTRTYTCSKPQRATHRRSLILSNMRRHSLQCAAILCPVGSWHDPVLWVNVKEEYGKIWGNVKTLSYAPNQNCWKRLHVSTNVILSISRMLCCVITGQPVLLTELITSGVEFPFG